MERVMTLITVNFKRRFSSRTKENLMDVGAFHILGLSKERN